MGEQEILRTSDGSSDEQFENAETEKEISEEEKYEVRREEWVNGFGAEGGRTDIISLCESEESGAGGLAEEGEEDEGRGDQDGHEDEDEYVEDEDDDEDDEDDDGEDEKEAEPKSTNVRGRILTAYNAPTSPVPPEKQHIINRPRMRHPGLHRFDTDNYRRYNLMDPNPGTAVLRPFRRSYEQYDDYALYINPSLKETELDQIPCRGVRVDDLTASKVLLYYSQRALHTRWPADFDVRGRIRATRVPLGRAAKRWVKSGEEDLEGKRVEEEGWYYLSWGGIYTFMGREGSGRYWVRPSREGFKCRGLGFYREDWAKVQLAPEDPEDPTFL